MTFNGWVQIGVFLAAVAGVTAPLGRFMTHVFNGRRTWLDPICRPIEEAIYRAAGIDPFYEMQWTDYARAALSFSAVSMAALYAILRLQQWLPWNPQHIAAVPPVLAFNT